jgi:hypothetical protein
MSGSSPVRVETEFASGGETYRLVVLYGRELEIISPLLQEVYGRAAFTPDWVRRKYACMRDGVPSFVCAALAKDGRPVSAVGMLPWPIRPGDRLELAGQLADSSTSAPHRGRGLHPRLMRLAHEVCEAHGQTFVFRFSNDLSLAITTSKLGYTQLGDLVEYHRPVRTLWAERLARRARLGDAYDRRVERITDPYVEPDLMLPSPALTEGYAGVDRDRAYFDYKAAFGRSRVLSLDGARVWLTVRHGVLVGDMEADSDATFDRGLDELERLARRLGAHRLLFQVPEDVRLSRQLATRLPQTRRRPLAYFDLNSKIPSDALRLTLGDIDTF